MFPSLVLRPSSRAVRALRVARVLWRRLAQGGDALLRRAATFRFAAPLCVAAGLACVVVAEIGSERLDRVFDQIRASYELRRDLRQLRLVALELESARRGYLLTQRTEYLEPYRQAFPQISELRSRIRAGNADDPQRLAQAETLGELLDGKVAELRATVSLVDRGRKREAFEVLRSKRNRNSAQRIQTLLDDLSDLEQADTEARVRQWELDLQLQRMTVASAVLLTVVLAVVLLRTVRRELDLERGQSARLDALVRSRTQTLSELATHLQEVREDEKASLARELHDELGAILTASRMDLAWIKRRLGDLPPELGAKFERVQAHLDQGVALKRRIIEGLVPSALINLGLIPALESLLEDFARSAELAISLDIPEQELPLRQDQAVAVYRIVQEALTNIQRHAQASRVHLGVHAGAGLLRVEVTDDGCGMAHTDLRQLRSHGLRGMAQRMEALGGRLELVSAPGKGCVVRVLLPIA